MGGTRHQERRISYRALYDWDMDENFWESECVDPDKPQTQELLEEVLYNHKLVK